LRIIYAPEISNKIGTLLTIGLVVTLTILSFEIGRSIAYAENATKQATAEDILVSLMGSTVAIISGLSGLTIAIGKWMDSLRQRGVLDKRWDKLIQVTHATAASLEETDRAFAESEGLRTALIKLIAKNPTIKETVESKEGQELFYKITKFQEDTASDIKSFYETPTATAGSDSNDPVVKGLARVESKLVPASSGVREVVSS
jgi:hypothetical protein